MRRRWTIVAAATVVLACGFAVHARDVTVSRVQAEGTLLQQIGYEYQMAGEDLQNIAAAHHSLTSHAAAADLLHITKLMRQTDLGLANVPLGGNALASCRDLQSALADASEIYLSESVQTGQNPSAKRPNAKQLGHLLSGLSGLFFGASQPLLKGDAPPQRYWSQAKAGLTRALSMAKRP